MALIDDQAPRAKRAMTENGPYGDLRATLGGFVAQYLMRAKPRAEVLDHCRDMRRLRM